MSKRLAIAWPRDLEQEDQHFGSGINDKGEVRGMLMSGRHLGVTASNMRPGMLRELSICRHGYTRLFVDSGAFSEVKFGPYRVVKPITDEQWRARFKLYRWAAATFRGRAYLVAPDRVGDQVVTLDRLTRYSFEVAYWAAYGANVIVPVQKGDLPMGEFFKLASQILIGVPSAQLIAGIPMQKDATSIAELRAFCETLPWYGARLHLLGIGPKARQGRFWRAVEAIKSVRPNAVITSDSAVVPGISGRTNGAGGKPRIYTALQDEARGKGLKTSAARKAYALTKQGHMLVKESIERAAVQGWRDTELDEDEEPAPRELAPLRLTPETRDGTVATYNICTK